LNIDYPVTIRPGTPQHIPDLIRLAGQSPTAAHWSDLQYWSLFPKEGQGSRIVLVAECDRPNESRDEEPTVVGFLIARQAAGELELENIVVAEEFRAKGVGKQLVQELLTKAQELNWQSIFLEVRESNTRARRFYEKLNFRETGRRKAYYSAPSEDAILYVQTLR
jgi:ribosomal-protein-alanine N-acetyltransferase